MNSYSSSSFTRRMNSTVSKYISSWITPYFSIRFLTSWLSAYSRLILNLTCSNTSTIPASSIAESAVSRYALESPPKPSFIPPKYRVTTTTAFRISFDSSILKTGFPELPAGSPSSSYLRAKELFSLIK